MRHGACVRSEDNLQESPLSPQYVGSGAEAEAIGLGGRPLYPLESSCWLTPSYLTYVSADRLRF